MNTKKYFNDCWDSVRIYLVPIIWLAYSIIFCWRIGELEVCKNSFIFWGLAVGWFLITFIIQFAIAGASVQEYDSKPFSYTWINIPSIAFILCMIGPYCFGLYQMSKDVDMTSTKEIAEHDFVVLQTIMPVLVITSILYPLPIRDVPAAGTASVMIGFLNAFDISDVIVDYKYIQHYSAATEAWFFVSVVISVILLAFPIGLDEEDEDDPECGRILKSLASLIFTDISFCVLRGTVMYKEDSLSIGLVFAYKNAISACISIYMLIKTCWFSDNC